MDHSCDAWEGDSSIIPIAELPSPCRQFFMKFHVRFTYPPSDLTDDDGDDDSEDDFDRLECHTRCMQFWVPCDRLICDDNNTSWSTISSMLCDLGIPLHVQPFMIHRILKSAESMVKQNLREKKVLPMIVSIDVVACAEDEEEYTMELRQVPASDASVEALEKVKVENWGTGMKCVICLEELLVGLEATRMPCSHVFHGDCILRWLRVSNFCPLCRFQMPISSCVDT
ncbi:RING-H2 finger protein ATL22-like [Cornus florida]|uniref:RING-H2 finger protein ATL22-like n=1 Tax=Cornus florida TaxID=4283 RepID=UPI00289FF906|nr:RING-H2 finger protein ATL22-like [Cornus florida]